MKTLTATIILFVFSLAAFCQSNIRLINGQVSYISSQNIYVKFENTQGIQIGDTIFRINENKNSALLIVDNLSSISVSGKPLTSDIILISTPVIAKVAVTIKEKSHNEKALVDKSKISESVVAEKIDESFSKDKKKKKKSDLDGRFSVSSYSNIAGSHSSQRLRYNLSLNANRIADTNLSAETYIAFTHKINESVSLNDALKIYSLSLKYDINKTTAVSFGRKINVNMANIGAVDGVQFEKNSKNFAYGLVLGSRPDYYDYSLNTKLLQAGAFVSHKLQTDKGNMQTSVAIFNQMNDFKTDRRFAYIQHSNSLVPKVDLFASAEIDFYTMVNLQPTNTIDLTSAYFSVRYKPFRKLSLSLSYDARKNIYYYETFKNSIDSILDKETRQGLRFNTTYRPFKNLIWGGTAGYRIQKPDTVAAINANTYLTYTNIPFINAAFTVNATYFENSFLNGFVYGAGLSRDLFKDNIYADLSYRHVNYSSINLASPIIQNIAELSLSWRIAKKLTLSVDFEGKLEQSNNTGTIYLNISQRF